MKAKIMIILGVPLLLGLVIIVYFALPWLLMLIGIQLEPNPSRPAITYGEFPFRLDYEINGERKVVQDTLICEYDGIGSNEGTGKYRKWKERFASGNPKILLLKVDGASGIAFGNKKTIYQEIFFDLGPAWYYMGDDEGGSGYKPIYPNASFSEQYQDGSGTKGVILADELLNKYNIKLISWDYTQPIRNNFSSTKK
ncbi:hypothetical protein [Paenibacillus alvei]|uniref:hypothetical protein n=1 Tax=Paenibacillus alvei TaxID=44250 RepID=UPI0003863A41|nr:hypothetical protein [Paenibacillus alvei]EPY14882.1 hypothetical protein PAAL66ix_00145 [Paenibacillus alvei A6-6i-x]